MLRTITLCSGKGGVGKTLLATTLARIIQREENCNVLLADLDVSVRGLTLLAFQNKIELDQVPESLTEYLSHDSPGEQKLFDVLHKSLSTNVPDGTQRALYRRRENILVLPASTESEWSDWALLTRMELEHVVEKLEHLQTFVRESLNVEYMIFDTHAGLGSLSLAAATLSDMNLIVLEEDDISWRTALNVLLEITELSKRLQKRSRNYFLANKVSTGFLEVANKLRAFSFLPPIPYDDWMHKLVAHATAAALEQEFEKQFESSDFFRQVRSHVWPEIAIIFGRRTRPVKNSAPFTHWWRTPKAKPKPPERRVISKQAAPPTRPDGAR